MDAQANEALKVLPAKTGTTREYKYVHHVVAFSHTGASNADEMSNELTSLKAHGWTEYHYHCDIQAGGTIVHAWVLCREIQLPTPSPNTTQAEAIVEDDEPVQKNLRAGVAVKLPTEVVTMVVSKQGERYRVEDGSVWDADDLVVVPDEAPDAVEEMSFSDAMQAGASPAQLKAIGNKQAVKAGLDELLKDKPHLSYIREHGAKAYQQLCNDRARTVFVDAMQRAYQPIQFPQLGYVEVK